jgi:hypothetical protein
MVSKHCCLAQSQRSQARQEEAQPRTQNDLHVWGVVPTLGEPVQH